jgi:uncharacterized protein (DUF1499 family)
MRILTTIGIGLIIFVAIVATMFVMAGADRFWRVFGEPDLGDVKFEQLKRRASANDALACPNGMCSAKVDIVTASYRVTARDLRAAFAKVIASEQLVATVGTNEAELSDRYIQRTPRLGYPDTIVVKFIDQQQGQSTLAIYSRSQFGESDFGVNKARIERWLLKLAEQVAPIK